MSLKKITVLAALCAALALPCMARDSDSGLGFSGGVRFSVLGMEPTVALIFNNLEVEASAPIQSQHVYSSSYNPGSVPSGQDVSDYVFGIAPEVSIGYNSKPFTSGWQNTVGASVLWLTDSFVNALAGNGSASVLPLDSNGSVDFSQGAYLGSFFYRGGIQWKSGLCLYFRVTVPLVAYVPSQGNAGFYSVMESEMAMASMAAAFTTTAVGIKFTF
ncbi:MAG: hypothetical protein IIT68_07720 [Treponema sp.]|nr:hypothetical protein [Treponema sp.]